jgi:SAM-dependent methyltransferase
MPQTLQEIEKRFLDVSGLNLDLSVFPLAESISSQVKTVKEKSNQYGEVFTPLWLVDKMILKATVEKLYEAKSTLDLCAGYGQFTIRMMRALANYDSNFDCNAWLKNVHTFIELQLSSCYKILYIFGIDINLFMGDALEVNKITNREGIYYFNGSWERLNKKWVRSIMTNEEKFISEINRKFEEKGPALLWE